MQDGLTQVQLTGASLQGRQRSPQRLTLWLPFGRRGAALSGACNHSGWLVCQQIQNLTSAEKLRHFLRT